jgi:transposase
MGHDVKLMPAAYAKLYLKRQKNDAADAEAICEVVQRPTMRFVPVKSEEQQGVLMLNRARGLLVRQKTMLINALRAYLAEIGISARLGVMGVRDLVALVEDTDQSVVPEIARRALRPLCDQLRHV